jgi:hypothetical protein
MDMALESSFFNAHRLVSGTKSLYLVPCNRQMRMPMKILEKSNGYPSQLVLNCIGTRGFRSYFSARCRVNDSSFAGRAGLKFVGEDNESLSDENAVYGVNLDFVRESVKRGIILAAIVCGVLVFGCKRVFAMEGLVNAGYGVIGRSMLSLRNAWPKTLQVLQVLKEQGLILAALLGLSAFFSMAETSITTLWPWKVRTLLPGTE